MTPNTLLHLMANVSSSGCVFE